MVAIIRSNKAPGASNDAPPRSNYIPAWPTAKGRPYNGRANGLGRKQYHGRRQLNEAERLRICEEYIAGYDVDLIVERWELSGHEQLRNTVRRLLGETAQRVRRMAKGERMIGEKSVEGDPEMG